MAFVQDPRLRQRWNQISHNAEAVTENAAAGIWTIQHRYINPCLASLSHSVDSCTGVCLGGDREERARRARERERGARRTNRAEYSFDFYDDWDDADDEFEPGFGAGGGSGLLGSWGGGRGEDWDRLLAGTGASSKHHGSGAGAGVAGNEIIDQPRRKRGMSYGTRGQARRKVSREEDPTVIPSTAPLGFLGRLPFRFGGTLRYKPSAATLKDHPGSHLNGEAAEHEPLLGTSDEEDAHHRLRSPQKRPRSGTAGSGDTSDSFRSRNDLFPSDEEGDEDAIPLDDEFAVALDRVDDRSSARTRSSKGKRRDDGREMSRTVSRTTISSTHTHGSFRPRGSSGSLPAIVLDEEYVPSLEVFQQEEEQAQREEDEEIERKRRAAADLASKRGLDRDSEAATEQKLEIEEFEATEPPVTNQDGAQDIEPTPEAVEDHDPEVPAAPNDVATEENADFVPARLPAFR